MHDKKRKATIALDAISLFISVNDEQKSHSAEKKCWKQVLLTHISVPTSQQSENGKTPLFSFSKDM